MSHTEDIIDGVYCMACGQLLISDAGEVCDAGHPLFCRGCWQQLPYRERKQGPPYFDKKTGEVFTA